MRATVLNAPQHPYSRQLKDAVLLPEAARRLARSPHHLYRQNQTPERT